MIQIYYHGELIAQYPKEPHKHQMVINPEHYRGLLKTPIPSNPSSKFNHPSPDVQIRSLDIYEAVAGGASHG